MARKAIYKHATEVDAATYPDDGSSPVGTNEWNEAPDAEGMFGNTPQTTTISIATGDLTVTDSVTVAAAETGITDTLDKLLITNTNEYDMVYLFAKTGQTITLTNTSSPSVSGQVKTVSGANEVLSTTKPTILIRNGNYWYGYGGSVAADGSITNAKLADMAAGTVKVRDSISTGVPSDIALIDTELLIGNGSGFNTASLSGDATMTNAGVVSVATLNQNTTGTAATVTDAAQPVITSVGTLTSLTVSGAITGDVTGNADTVTTNANLTGDVTSVGNATTTVTNANLTGVVTSTGNATAIANGAIATSKISGFDTQVQTSRLDQMAAPAAAVALGSQKITGVADGVSSTDAATKGQVDASQAGLDSKYACAVATTANITLSGEQTIDGVLTSTDRVLVKNQTTASENGIYVSASGSWSRSTDANTSAKVTSGLYTLITEGTAGAGQGFVLVTADPITLNTTALTFSQFSGVGDLVGGTGITKAGNTISVDASQTQITAIGTLTSGTLTGATGLPPAGVVGTAAILGANTFTADQTITEAGTAEIIRFRNQSLDGQFIAKDTYKNLSSTSVERIIAQNIMQTTDYTNGAEDGSQRMHVMENGTLTEYLNIQGAGAKIIAYKPLDMSGTDIDNIQNLVHDVSAMSGTAINFNNDQVETMGFSANLTLTTSNRAIGRSKTLKMSNTSGSTVNLTFPAWKFVGTKPTDIEGNKIAILTVTCFGTADTDIVAAYAVEE